MKPLVCLIVLSLLLAFLSTGLAIPKGRSKVGCTGCPQDITKPPIHH